MRDGRSAGRQDRHVRDTAEVEGDGGAVLGSEQQRVEERHEGRPVAAGGDVADAEVRHHGDSGCFRDPRGLADLERAEAARPFDPVVDGLAVGGDRVDRSGTPDRLGGGGCERLPDERVELAHLGQRRLSRGKGGEQSAPQ